MRNQLSPSGITLLSESINCLNCDYPDCRKSKDKFQEALSQWVERQNELENSEEQHEVRIISRNFIVAAMLCITFNKLVLIARTGEYCACFNSLETLKKPQSVCESTQKSPERDITSHFGFVKPESKHEATAVQQ